MFRPLARFRVTGCTKLLTEGDLRDDVHPNNGFPDNVQLQQLPMFDPMAVLQAKAAQFRPAAALAADRDRARHDLTAERARRAEVEMANARMHAALEDERQRARQAQQQLAATEAELQRCRQALHEQETRIAQMQQGADGFAGGGAHPSCAEAVPQVCKYCKQAMPPSGQRECPVRETVEIPRARESLARVAALHQRRQRCMRP